jgi:hypothetical protein
MLVDGTVPEYSSASADSGQTIEPGLLVYKSGTAPDPEVTVCGAMYGSSFEDEATIYVVEIPASHPSFPSAYDKSTAFTAQTDTFSIHRISLGDRIWLKGSSLSLNETDTVCTAADGTVIQYASATIDKWNVHTFRIIGTWATATWVIGEYVGRTSQDTA